MNVNVFCDLALIQNVIALADELYISRVVEKGVAQYCECYM